MSIIGMNNDSPAKFFLELWEIATKWSSPERSIGLSGEVVRINLESVLLLDDGEIVTQKLRNLLTKSLPDVDYRRTVLNLMCAIDSAIFAIHPRVKIPPGSAKSRRNAPEWVRELRDRRNLHGNYAENNKFALVTRGPLTRSARSAVSSNAECLADRFVAISVVPMFTSHNGRSIKIDYKVFGTSAAGGVAPVKKNGEEKIAFIPVAESNDSLNITERVVEGCNFVDFRMNPNLDASDLFLRAIHAAGLVDIAIAPEFVMSSQHADKLSEGLRALGAKSPRLVVAGSGLTFEETGCRPWNESRVLNGAGSILWRQRKIWPAAILRERAIEFGLSDPGQGMTYEDTDAGNEVIVADIEAYGRCIVLICQDIEARSLSEDLIDSFQPDWIFVPILDRGIRLGGWVHARSFALSGLSHARYLISCSTILAKKTTHSVSAEPACGLAIGPKTEVLPDGGRMYLMAQVDPAKTPGYSTITWRTDGWSQTTLI